MSGRRFYQTVFTPPVAPTDVVAVPGGWEPVAPVARNPAPRRRVGGPVPAGTVQVRSAGGAPGPGGLRRQVPRRQMPSDLTDVPVAPTAAPTWAPDEPTPTRVRRPVRAQPDGLTDVPVGADQPSWGWEPSPPANPAPARRRHQPDGTTDVAVEPVVETTWGWEPFPAPVRRPNRTQPDGLTDVAVEPGAPAVYGWEVVQSGFPQWARRTAPRGEFFWAPFPPPPHGGRQFCTDGRGSAELSTTGRGDARQTTTGRSDARFAVGGDDGDECNDE